MATDCETGQILFLRKNHIDLNRPNPVITITDAAASNTGQDSVIFLRNRNNISGWLTTGSEDATPTVMTVSACACADHPVRSVSERYKGNFIRLVIDMPKATFMFIYTN